MKIAVLIPDRGDRPKFLENCLRMVEQQTLYPDVIMVVDDPPVNDQCDITLRYRTGYTRLRNRGYDLIAFMESDDWYSPQYLEYMVKKWEENGRPDLLGLNYTIYYHLKLRKYFTFRHVQRSSAMSTFIKPDLAFTWPKDHDPYTDQWLWINALLSKKVVIEPDHVICVGMKHGVGKVGGDFHTDRLHRYINEDNGFLKNTIDPDSYKFYDELVLE